VFTLKKDMKMNYKTLLLLCVFSLFFRLTVSAATIVVHEASDAALRGAIANAAPGDSITFDLSLFNGGAVTIPLAGAISINKNLSVIGPDNATLILDGKQREIFTVASLDGCHVLLRNMTLRNGGTRGEDGETKGAGGGGGAGLGGAIYVNVAILTCQSIIFENNSATGGNGGIGGWIGEHMTVGGKGGNSSRGLGIGGAGGYFQTTLEKGGNGGHGSGGGGGASTSQEIFSLDAPSDGGSGGFGGGGGGGGGGRFLFANPGNGGEFGGHGESGRIFINGGGGGGGAGLGGAIFVDSSGGLVLDQCIFRGNKAVGGYGTIYKGQGKGGAVFARPNVLFQIFDTSFHDNTASEASGTGFSSGVLSDTGDIYGTASNYVPTPTPSPTMTPTFTPTPTPTMTPTMTPVPQDHVIVTTLIDEHDGPFLGQGISLREAIQLVSADGQITFDASILPGTCTIEPTLNTLIIDRKVNIVGPGIDQFTLNGNNMRVFFVKEGSLNLSGMRIVNGVAQGGHGGNGAAGGGGAAGMGGAIFVNKNASVSVANMVFEKCVAQGGIGGNGNEWEWHLFACGGGGGISESGENGDGKRVYIYEGNDNYRSEIHRWGGLGGKGWPIGNEQANNSVNGGDGGGGGGSKIDNNRGGDGGFGGGGGGSYVEGTGCGGFGGGGSAVVFPSIKMHHLAFGKPNPGGAFGGGGYGMAGGGGAGLGGAIFVREGGTLTIDDCQFKQNTAAGGRGGTAWFHLSYCPFPWRDYAWSGQGQGGTIFVMEGGKAIVGNLHFKKNRSDDGKGVGLRFGSANATHDVWGNIEPLYNESSLPQTLHFNANIPLSGPLAYYGAILKQGYDLAVQDLNRNNAIPGSQVVMNYYDNQSLPDSAAQGYRTAAADSKNWAVFTDISMLSNAILKEASGQQNPLSVFTTATFSGLRRFKDHAVKASPLDSYQAVAITREIQRLQGDSRNIVILADDTEYGSGIVSAMENDPSITIKGKFLFSPGELAVNPAKAQEAAAELAKNTMDTATGVLACYAEDGNAFLKVVMDTPELRYHQWILTDGCVYPSVLKGLPLTFCQNNLIGLTPGVSGFLDPSKKDTWFQYEKEFGVKPTWDAAYAYDAVCLCAEIIHSKLSYPTRDLVFEQIPFTPFSGASGLKKFDSEGELISAVYDLKRVKNNEWVTMGQERVDQPSTTNFPPFGDFAPPTPLSTEGFRQWLDGNDPEMGHFWGEPHNANEWKAQSIDVEYGWNLIAYYEDTARQKNAEGVPFGFQDGKPYHISFDMTRSNQVGAPETGIVLKIDVFAVSRYIDSSGQENYQSKILTSKPFLLEEWPGEKTVRLDIPLTYKMTEVPHGSTRTVKDNLLYWTIQLMNSARQEVVLKKVWTWSAPPEDGGLPDLETPIKEWVIYE
jgi:ABC-type branched-subunit amino acid transport system substrate-binding protein